MKYPPFWANPLFNFEWFWQLTYDAIREQHLKCPACVMNLSPRVTLT